MSFRGRRTLYNTISAITVSIIMVLCFFILISLVFNIFYVKTYVRGYSMQPTLNTNIKDPNINGDTIYINTVSDYHANDIVVAEVSWWSKGPIIKRIVGCPGDKVEIRDLDNNYGLFVNETLLYTKEKTIVSNHGSLGGTNMHYRQYLNFLNNPSNQDNVGINSLGEKCIVLNEDEYMLVGDNWGESTDCLYHSPVKSSDIVGKVELIIPYENENNFSTLFSFMMRKVFC